MKHHLRVLESSVQVGGLMQCNQVYSVFWVFFFFLEIEKLTYKISEKAKLTDEKLPRG